MTTPVTPKFTKRGKEIRQKGTPKYCTFDGWRNLGRTVNKGEKKCGLRDDRGVPLFHFSQTSILTKPVFTPRNMEEADEFIEAALLEAYHDH